MRGLDSSALGSAGPADPGRGAPSRRPSDWFRERARRLRRGHVALIALAVALFVLVSVLLARFLQTENVERDEVLAVLSAQARGDARGMLAKLNDCASSTKCTATVRANAARLRRAGLVKILSLSSHTAYSLTGSTGATRVAWTVIGRLPVVQCVQVRRSGDFIGGMSVKLLSISAPIQNEADC